MKHGLVEELEEAIKENKTLDYGIYAVNDTIVAKRGRSKKDSYMEYTMGKFLFEHDIVVPEMYQFVSLETILSKLFFGVSHFRSWFVLMQKIQGVPINLLQGNEFNEAFLQYKAQQKEDCT